MNNKIKRLRNKRFNFYVTENENMIIRDKAKFLDMSLGEYLRKMAIDGMIIKKDFNQVFYELNKIGVNINQIAKKVNENETITEKDFFDLKAEVESIFELYYSAILS